MGGRDTVGGDTFRPAAPGWPLAQSPVPGRCRARMRQSPRVGWAGKAPRWLPAASWASHSHHSLPGAPGQEAGTSPPGLPTQAHLSLPAVCRGGVLRELTQPLDLLPIPATPGTGMKARNQAPWGSCLRRQTHALIPFKPRDHPFGRLSPALTDPCPLPLSWAEDPPRRSRPRSPVPPGSP